MYTVYRVIVSLFFIGTVLSVVYYDLYEDETTLPRLSMLLHYGYWAFLVLTIDFFLQVMIRLKSCIGPAHVGVDRRFFPSPPSPNPCHYVAIIFPYTALATDLWPYSL